MRSQQNEPAASSTGNRSILDKSTKDDGLSASLSESQPSISNARADAKEAAELHAAGARPKGRAIDPYVKGEQQSRSLKKLTEEPELPPEQYQEMIELFMQDQE